MRRVIFAVTGTIAGLVALLSFKSHAPTLAAATGTTGGSSSPRSSSSSVPGEFPTGSVSGNSPRARPR